MVGEPVAYATGSPELKATGPSYVGLLPPRSPRDQGKSSRGRTATTSGEGSWMRTPFIFGKLAAVRILRSAAGLGASLCLISIMPAPATANEEPATIRYDPYTRTTSIDGQSHRHNTLFDLDKWEYWLSAAIINGIPRNPILMFSTDTPGWYFFDRAADIDGNPLPVIQGNRQLQIGGVQEVIGIELTPQYLADHRTTGFNLKIMGRRGERIVVVPPDVVATFETSYLAEVERAGGFRNDLLATNSAVAPSPSQISQAASNGADAAAARGGFGISFVVVPQGAVLMAVSPGSRAERGQLKTGQLVTAINGATIAGMTQADILTMLRGSAEVTTFTIAGIGDVAVAP
jgi:hypothetical protein